MHYWIANDGTHIAYMASERKPTAEIYTELTKEEYDTQIAALVESIHEMVIQSDQESDENEASAEAGD